MPTLGQVCQLITELGADQVTLCVELKTHPSWLSTEVRKLTESALGTLAAHQVIGQSRILAFDWRVLRAAAAAESSVPRVALVEPSTWRAGSGWLAGLDPTRYGDGPGGYVAAARDVGAAWISPEDQMTDADLVAAAHRDGLRVAVWTVNDPARMDELTALGVDGIVSDRPDLFLKGGNDGLREADELRSGRDPGL